MTADEKRKSVVEKYSTLLNRNKYNQTYRNYCFKPYTDGCYYSDCSSSISYSYKQAGYSFGILNTVGMYSSKLLSTVDVVITNGLISTTSINKLRIGDMLLFAGVDSSRKAYEYVGHVEMIYSISGTTVTLCGHPSGTPRTINMNKYCTHMFNSKTTNTTTGNRGLIKVVRYIQDDEYSYNDFINDINNVLGTRYTAKGLLMKTKTLSIDTNKNDKLVTPIERYLKQLGYYSGSIEEDEGKNPIFGSGLTKAVKLYQKEVVKATTANQDGIITARNNTWKCLLGLK